MKARNIWQLVFVFSMAFVFGVGAASAEEQVSPKELMRRVDKANRTEDSQRTLTMRDYDKKGRQKRQREVISYRKKIDEDNDKVLVGFLSPGDVTGVGLLTIEHSDRDDDQWLFLPALGKTRRISSADKSDSFMGTQFTYEDMSSMKLDEYDYKELPGGEVDGVKCRVIEMVPNNDKRRKDSGYSKSVSWVDPERAVILKSDFYNLKGQHLKTLTVSKVNKYGGVYMPDYMVMENVRESEKTELEFKDTKVGTGIRDDFFTEDSLVDETWMPL